VRTLAAVVVCLVLAPAGVFAWATSHSRPAWTVDGAREVLAAQGFQGISTPELGNLHGKTPAERVAFRQVRGLVFGHAGTGGVILFVTADDAAARGLYRLAQSEGADFGGSRLEGAAVRNVLIDYVRPRGGPDGFRALVAAFSR
jgi:hypothetical protein